MRDFYKKNRIVDSWYKDDQFENQFSSPSKKEIIYNRWFFFGRIINKNLNNLNEVNILDLGCGDGVNIIGLKEIFSEMDASYNIEAWDYNEDRLRKVSERFPELTTKKFDLVSGSSDKTFDLILFNHVLEHISNDSKAINNLYKLLKKNGILILGVPNEGCFIAKMRNKVFQSKITDFTDHVHFYTLKTLSNLVSENFKIENIFREGFFMPHDRIQFLFRATKFGRRMLNLFLWLFPSQSAGIILGLKKR